jgi:hypothetical protein
MQYVKQKILLKYFGQSRKTVLCITVQFFKLLLCPSGIFLVSSSRHFHKQRRKKMFFYVCFRKDLKFDLLLGLILTFRLLKICIYDTASLHFTLPVVWGFLAAFLATRHQCSAFLISWAGTVNKGREEIKCHVLTYK